MKDLLSISVSIAIGCLVMYLMASMGFRGWAIAVSIFAAIAYYIIMEVALNDK